MASHVIVIGGGVAGLTAAHELVERGFTVNVYEPRPEWGGKARSQPVPGTASGARKPLPGEHGFRFYPRFYKHVIDTMARIPGASAATSSITCGRRPRARSRCRRRHLVPVLSKTAHQAVRHPRGARAVLPGARLRRRRHRAVRARRSSSSSPRATRAGSASTSSISWWDFLEGDLYSPKFQRQLRAVPRTMVAMDPQARLGAHGRHDLDAADPRLRRHRREQRPHDGRTDDRDVDRSVDRAPAARSASSSTPASRSTASRLAAGTISGVRSTGDEPDSRRRLLRARRADRRRDRPDHAGDGRARSGARSACAPQRRRPRVVDGRHPVLPLRGRPARPRPHVLSGLAVGADLDLAAAVLARPRLCSARATATATSAA